MVPPPLNLIAKGCERERHGEVEKALPTVDTIPWVPWGALENLRASRPQNASPRFHSAPAAPTAAHRQASRGPRGPRAAKCVTTHHDAFPRGVSLATPLPPPGLPRAFGLP